MSTEHDDELKLVKLPSGATLQVYKQEVKYIEERVKQYTTHNQFTNIADLQDLDQVVSRELLIWRYTNWVARQRDYWDEAVDESGFNKQLKDLSAELRATKSALGLDKVSRDKARGDDSIATYIEQLGVRAKAFGYNRNNMQAKAIELGMEVLAKLTLHDNCTPDERAEQHCTEKDIIEWLRIKFKPDFEAVDEAFRNGEQKMWIRSQ